jgi:site-specific DNA recombinase
VEAGAAVIEAALDLLDNPQELYRQTSDPVRRQLNEVFFERLYLDTDEVIDDRLAKPLNDFLHPNLNRRRVMHTRGHRVPTPSGAPHGRRWRYWCRPARPHCYGESLNNSNLVELRGLEPLTSSMPWWPAQRT